MRVHRTLVLLLTGLLAVPAAAAENRATPTYKSVLIEDVPHVRQKPDFCGEACAEMFLKKLGKPLDQDFVFDQSGLDPIHGRGCFTRELATALRRVGFVTGNVWYRVARADHRRQMELQFRDLHADLAKGVPSIICMHYDDSPESTEHFRLMLGYDADTDEVIYHEPAEDDGGYRRMKRNVLLKLWPLKYEERTWTVVRFRLEPGRLADGRAATTLTRADYAQHILKLKRELGQLKTRQIALKKQREEEIAAEKKKVEEAKEKKEEYEPRELPRRIVSDFSIVVEEPFVVVGDDHSRTVRDYAQGTIRWAVERLKKDYFTTDPDHVITIWLFKDERSYVQNLADIFRTWPHTPFGYYSPRERVLVMNIDTGTGTLVHEIVHPFIEANFPECPSWFNEGLGSLYEQCRDRNGHIWGRTNWRLRGLHEAIKDEEYEMPTFETLCSTTPREFYSEDPGTNYAQARYLCYYLQQKGLLVKYYHEFVGAAAEDPTGYETLKRILGEEDMDAFQKKWSEYVLTLRY